MKKLSILLLVFVAVLASCKKTPEVNLKYVDVERDLVTVGMTTANIQCDYEYITTLKKAYLYYGEGEDEIDMAFAEMQVVQKTLYVELSGLKENTTYHYYYEFVNGFNSMRSALKTFKTEASPTSLATVITAAVTEITTNSAKGGGEVTNDGGAEVTERGICWGINTNPTLNDSHIVAGTGTGVFTTAISGLEANTTYHVRAYATNEAGTAYGLDKEFTTLGGGSGAPEGAINGLFSVSPTQKVYFSQGNLQYQASTNTWRFADNQWDYVGDSENGTVFENGIKCDNALISSIYDGWIDLFGWGTSGYNHGAVCWQPWSTGAYTGLYNVYGFSNYNLYDQTGEADWGYNAIYNGGNQENSGWRTLTIDEWDYLLNNRNTVSGIRYAKAKVNGINGIVVLPDDWNSSYYPLDNINGGGASFDNNTISISQWETLEQYGAGFLPITGNRHGTGIIHNSIYTGYYWSASCDYNDNDGSYFIVIQEPTEIVLIPVYRGNGFAVRLAKNAFSQPPIYTPTVITSDVSNVTSNSAYCGGEVTNDGGATVTERGICWSTNTNPTLTDSHVAAGSGMGAFTAVMSGMQANTTYHVRAYATNEVGISYGQDKVFTTLEGGGGNGAPEGAINGLFSVSPTKRVYFSKGNLQYQASTNTWRFAENQWDFVGGVDVHTQNALGTVYEDGIKCDNSQISSSYNGWIDLFGWGTSGWDNGNVYYMPYDYAHDTCSSLFGPPYSSQGLINTYRKSDWGVYNRISNGGNKEGIWRTMSAEEWDYLIKGRDTPSGLLYVRAKIGTVNGLIVLPDDWDINLYSLNTEGGFANNTISTSDWIAIFETHGALFLPAAGERYITRYVCDNYLLPSGNYAGQYWSVTNESLCCSLCSIFYQSTLYIPTGCTKNSGNSVRLVQDVHP